MNISERPDPTQTKQHSVSHCMLFPFETCPFHASHTIHSQLLLEIGFVVVVATYIFVTLFLLIFGLSCHRVVYRGHDIFAHISSFDIIHTFDAVVFFHFFLLW